MKKTLYLSVILALAACSSEPTEEIDEQRLRDSIRAELEEEMLAEKEVLKFNPTPSKEVPLSEIEYPGAVQFKRTWVDANGDNIAVFTKTDEELYMLHYAFPNGSPILKRKVIDFVRDCPFDVTLEFVENTIEVTDLDNDNFGEVSFMYKTACRSDMSPATLKYLTIEDGEKYIIRGSELMDFGYEEPYGGEMNIDASFENGPTSFLVHAKKVWMENYRFD